MSPTGRWEQARTLEEIAATLDGEGIDRDPSLMPEMKGFCEGRYIL